MLGYQGRTDPTIQWYTVTRGGQTDTPTSDWDPVNRRSSITFTPEIEDNGKIIGCKNPESGQVRIYVEKDLE